MHITKGNLIEALLHKSFCHESNLEIPHSFHRTLYLGVKVGSVSEESGYDMRTFCDTKTAAAITGVLL